MKKVYEVLIPTILLFLLNFLFNYMSERVTSPDGEIIMGNAIKLDSVNFAQFVTVNNKKSKSINDFQFYIESGRISKVNVPEEIKITIDSKREFKINQIFPNGRYEMLVYFSLETSHVKIPSLKALNYEDFNFDLINLKEDDNDIDWSKIWILSISMAVTYLIFLLVIHNRFEQHRLKNLELRSDIEKSLKEREKLVERQKQIEVDQKVLKTSLAKMSLLLQKKCKDLKKENLFYRELIPQFVNSKEKELDEEKVHEIVRQSLKTYASISNIELAEVDTIDIMSSVFKKADD